jgi:hypothetical protein
VPTYRVTESTPDDLTWSDPDAYRVIHTDGGVQSAAVRYCELTDPAWLLDKRRGDPTLIRRLVVHVLTPSGEVWDVPIVAGVASWQYRDDDSKPMRRRRD